MGEAAVDATVAKGILQGYAKDNSFKPSKPITRAEAVVTLDRAVNAKATVYSSAGTYGPATGTETIEGDVVISVTGVTLQNIIITGNLLFSEGVEEGDARLNNVKIKGVTRVEGGGVNSIYLNHTFVTSLIVDKKKGPVRIVVEGSQQWEKLRFFPQPRFKNRAPRGLVSARLFYPSYYPQVRK